MNESAPLPEPDIEVIHSVQGPFEVELHKDKESGRVVYVAHKNILTGITSKSWYDPRSQTKTRSLFLAADGTEAFEERYAYDSEGYLLETKTYNAKGEEVGIEDDKAIRESMFQSLRDQGLSPAEAEAGVRQISNEELEARTIGLMHMVDEENPQ